MLLSQSARSPPTTRPSDVRAEAHVNHALPVSIVIQPVNAIRAVLLPREVRMDRLRALAA